jgi:hypothetical protein
MIKESNFEMSFGNARDARALVKIGCDVVDSLEEIAAETISEVSRLGGRVCRMLEGDSDIVLKILANSRDKCCEMRDVLGDFERSGRHLPDEDCLGVFCYVARKLSGVSHEADLLFSESDLKGEAVELAVSKMRDFHGKAACLEQMGYLWLGRKKLPRQGRSQIGRMILECMNFGPPRLGRAGTGGKSVQRLVDRGFVLVESARWDLKDAGSRRGR